MRSHTRNEYKILLFILNILYILNILFVTWSEIHFYFRILGLHYAKMSINCSLKIQGCKVFQRV
jgi:hypothetical protein